MTIQSYMVHESYYDGDGTAWFGPVPADIHEDDLFDSEACDYWSQTGEVTLRYAFEPLPETIYVNPWSVWLDPDSDVA